MSDAPISLSASALDSLFPFGIVVGASGEVSRVGPAVRAAVPSLVVGVDAGAVLAVEGEAGALTFEALAALEGNAVQLRTREGLLLRGQIVPLGDDLLFAGSPWPVEDEAVHELPVDGELYAPHDATYELGEMLFMQNFALEEAHSLADRLAAQQKELERQNKELAAKHETILHLSAPTIRLWDDVLAVPIVGTLDSDRIEAIMRAIARHLTVQQGRYVLVDLTGAEAVDTTTVRALTSLSSVARMLGARFMLTGIQPAIGQTIVELGLDMSDFESFVSAGDALRVVLAESSSRRAAEVTPKARFARARKLASRMLHDDAQE